LLYYVTWFFVSDVVARESVIVMFVSVIKNVFTVTMMMNVWLVVLEQEIQETQDVLDTEDISELHQLQQQLQQANERIAQLLQQREPTSQSQGPLFIMTL